MKPPFAYYGGKTKIAPQIAAMLPPHEHYVEPFAGGLSVLLAKPRSRAETVNDLDRHIVTFWRALREQPKELIRVCALTPHSRAEWEDCIDIDGPTDLETARRFWVRITQGRAGRVGRTGWRQYIDPSNTSTTMPGYLDGYVGRMAAVGERLHDISLECRPALDIIDRYGKCADVLFYLDPPYLGSVRRQDRSYQHELMDPEEHREIAAAVRSCAAAVVISGYASDLYDRELYPDWHRTEIRTGTGQGNYGWSNRVEVLWSNRVLDGRMPLFDEEAS